MVELREREGRVVASVSDNGPGMPADVMNRAFEAFFTTKPEERGTGLGLAICRSIVEDLGGSIEITSAEGEGTTVNVILPACGSTDRSVRSESSSTRTEATSADR